MPVLNLGKSAEKQSTQFQCPLYIIFTVCKKKQLVFRGIIYKKTQLRRTRCMRREPREAEHIVVCVSAFLARGISSGPLHSL